jgi:hypothetical protein
MGKICTSYVGGQVLALSDGLMCMPRRGQSLHLRLSLNDLVAVCVAQWSLCGSRGLAIIICLKTVRILYVDIQCFHLQFLIPMHVEASDHARTAFTLLPLPPVPQTPTALLSSASFAYIRYGQPLPATHGFSLTRHLWRAVESPVCALQFYIHRACNSSRL